MNEVISREIKWGNQVLSIETGKVAKQATASTIVRYGETVDMANDTAAKEAKTAIDATAETLGFMSLIAGDESYSMRLQINIGNQTGDYSGGKDKVPETLSQIIGINE